MKSSQTKLLPKPSELEIAPPDEKLLREPTFFEKNNPTKLFIFIIALIFILVIGSNIFYNDVRISTSSIHPPVRTPIKVSNPYAFKYFSMPELLSFNYPYNFYINEDIVNRSIDVVSGYIPAIQSPIQMTITYAPFSPNQSLVKYIHTHPICPSAVNSSVIPAIINGSQKGMMLLNIGCNTQIVTAAYTVYNGVLYTFTVKSHANYDQIRPYMNPIFSSLRFYRSGSAG
jgi:hypothetical protein